MHQSQISSRVRISQLLKPHRKALFAGVIAVILGGVANLLEPWPLKIVVDNLLRSQPLRNGWLNHFILSAAGTNKLAILKLASIAFIAIAIIDADCSYVLKYVTTSVGQWVVHDLRRAVYSQIQRLSLSYHDQSQTGDLLSRVTSDIDAVQRFIVSGLLDALINCLMLAGMLGVMFYLNWRFTLVALAIAPVLAIVAYSYTRRIKKASREVRKKEGEIVSVMQEALISIRLVNAFAQEDYEQERLEEESLEGVELTLRARKLKAKLAPFVEVIVAFGTALILWLGGRMALT